MPVPEVTPEAVERKEQSDFVAKYSADDAATSTEATKTAPASGTKAKAEHQESKTPAAGTNAEHDDDTEVGDDDEGAGGEAGNDADDDDDASGETEGETETTAEDGTGDEPSETDRAAAAATGANAKRVNQLLADAGLKVNLKDLDPKTRAIVQKQLDHGQAAITRVLQEQAKFRKERAELVAERQFFAEHPEQAIAEVLAKNPDLIEQVQAEIDKLEDPDKKKLFEITVRENREAALKSVTKAVADAEARDRRGDEIEAYVARASSALGIPKSVAEQAVALALLEKPYDARNLTEAELDAVLTPLDRVLKGHMRRSNLDTAKAGIRERTKDRRTSTPAVRGGNGTVAPAPAGRPKPKNDDEFKADFLSRMG